MMAPHGWRSREWLWLAVLLPALAAAPLSGQEAAPAVKSCPIRRLAEPPRLDGRLDDPCWREIEPVSGFVQFDPANGAPATEPTRVWMAYDQKNIYFACHMKDSQPGRIWAELTPRNAYENNDSFSVILDTYHDQRTSVTFTVNPRGIQKNSLETIWRCQAALLEDGWSAEIAIPFKSLRFSTAEQQVWGVNFERYIPRLKETDYWTRVDRDKPFLLQMGEIRGLSEIRPGGNMEFFPYVGFRSSRQQGDGAQKDDKLAYGMDFKYGITSNLTLDLTASPDFSEVESDPFIYQLSPYETYFFENRPFFSEGSQYFEAAGQEEYEGPSYAMFYSRRISDPKAAAKLTGKSRGWAFGLLGAIQDEEAGPDSYFTVARVQKDLFHNSQVGFYYAGVEGGGQYNRNLAVDYSFNFKDVYTVRGQSLLSLDSRGPKRDNAMHFIQFQNESDTGWQWILEYRRVEPNVRLRGGYASQTDVQRSYLEVGYAWRFDRGRLGLQRWSVVPLAELRHDAAGNAVGQSVGVGSWLFFFNQMRMEFQARAGRSRYQVDGGNEALVWSGEYIPTRELSAELSWDQGGLLKEVSLEAGFARTGVYGEDFRSVAPGRETSVAAELVLRPRSNLEWSGELGWTRQVLDSGAATFDGTTYETGLHLQVDRNLFLNARLLGETRFDQYSADLLAGYYFGAGNVVQLSYKKSARDEFGRRVAAHSVTLKFSYLLRI